MFVAFVQWEQLPLCWKTCSVCVCVCASTEETFRMELDKYRNWNALLERYICEWNGICINVKWRVDNLKSVTKCNNLKWQSLLNTEQIYIVVLYSMWKIECSMCKFGKCFEMLLFGLAMIQMRFSRFLVRMANGDYTRGFHSETWPLTRVRMDE